MPPRRSGHILDAMGRFSSFMTVLVMAVFTGCDRPAPMHRYLVLAGVVSATAPDTGELAVLVAKKSSNGTRDEPIDCVVTKDSEVYIDGRFAQAGEIELGDVVTLVGYYDANPRTSRFVVSYAYFQHERSADLGSGPRDDSPLSSTSKPN